MARDNRNSKVSQTDLPADGLTWVGARDTCVSKKKERTWVGGQQCQYWSEWQALERGRPGRGHILGASAIIVKVNTSPTETLNLLSRSTRSSQEHYLCLSCMGWTCLFQLLWCCTWWNHYDVCLFGSGCSHIMSIADNFWRAPNQYVDITSHYMEKWDDVIYDISRRCSKICLFVAIIVCLTCVLHWWSLYRQPFQLFPPLFRCEIWRKKKSEVWKVLFLQLMLLLVVVGSPEIPVCALLGNPLSFSPGSAGSTFSA